MWKIQQAKFSTEKDMQNLLRIWIWYGDEAMIFDEEDDVSTDDVDINNPPACLSGAYVEVLKNSDIYAYNYHPKFLYESLKTLNEQLASKLNIGTLEIDTECLLEDGSHSEIEILDLLSGKSPYLADIFDEINCPKLTLKLWQGAVWLLGFKK